MIPYIYIPTIAVGPLTVHVWGFFVSLGFVTAILAAVQRAKKQGLDSAKILDLSFWIFIGAFIGARFFHVFFYDWAYYRAASQDILKIWQGGLSSFGGFIGAAGAFFIYARRAKLDLLKYADVFVYAFPLGWGLGRVGCFLTHMHVGRLSNWPIAVDFPGGSRLDMGFIEVVVMLLYGFVLLLYVDRREHFLGFYLVTTMIFYGLARFIPDFGRATDIPMADARYLGLTPSQYGSIMLTLLGLFLVKRLRIRTRISRRV